MGQGSLPSHLLHDTAPTVLWSNFLPTSSFNSCPIDLILLKTDSQRAVSIHCLLFLLDPTTPWEEFLTAPTLLSASHTSKLSSTGPFHPHRMQPVSGTEAAGWPLHLKHVLWAPGHCPLSVFCFPYWLLLSVFLLAPHSEKTQGSVPGPLFFPIYPQFVGDFI